MHSGRDGPSDQTGIHAAIAGRPGEMRARIRELDWRATSLGPRENWPQSLQLSVEIILAAGFPMAVRWGPELIMIYNDAFRAILGKKHPDALGRPLRAVWPEIYDAVGPLSEAVMRGERETYFAEDIRRVIEREGIREEAWFTTSYSPIPDSSAPGTIGGILVTTLETTARVHDEERLRELSHGLETEVALRTRERDRIWQVSEDLLGVSNFDGYFTSINPAWTRLLGWSEDEIKSMHVSTLRHPDDAPAAIAGRVRLAQGAPLVRMENRFRHKDGSWRWLAWTMSADQGLIYVSGRHVTAEKEAAEALRESERQFRLLVAGVTDYSLHMLDANGLVSSWNEGAERMKGYAADEIIGRHFSCFYTERDRASGVPDRSLAVATKDGRFESEGWRVRKDGSLFWANVVIEAIRDEGGELIGLAKITRDGSERREAQAALEKSQMERAQLQKMEALGQLTGGVAHDFNNLLMIVSGHIQTLKKVAAGDPKAARATEAIEIAAQRGEALTRQLLTFSRRQTVNPVDTDLAKSIKTIQPLLLSSIGTAVNLEIVVEEGLWPVRIDLSELELALVNITINARDALPHGGTIKIVTRNVRLEPAATPQRLEGDFVAISVSDDGAGIAPDILPKIFDPFFTTKRDDKGTGLGLSQVHGFAHQSDGTVTVESELGQGTTVTLYLPRTQGTPAEIADEAKADPSGGGTVLLVEDNPEVAEVTSGLLNQLGYIVHAASDSDRALELLQRHKVDLVVSDIVMAGRMDGVRLARTIRRYAPEIPIILVTGYAESADRAVKDFTVLRKPYQIGELSRAAARALAEARQGGAG